MIGDVNSEPRTDEIEARVPSGRQVEIVHGAQRAWVTEVGAGLRSYEIDGREVVDGYGVTEMASGGRGQVLLPWPNRIGDGRYRFQGVDYQLPLSEPAKLNASHGLLRWSNWMLEQPGHDRVHARYLLHPQPGYPFSLRVEIDYQLSETGLRVHVATTNVGDRAAPYGFGQHPYVTVGTDLVDAAVLQVPGGAVIPTDTRGLPTGGPLAVGGTDLDFLRPRLIGPAILDTCYTDLRRGAGGVTSVVLANPDGDTVTVWGDRTVNYVMVFTGDTLAPQRRRRGLAIEPMTCPPDAFRSGVGLLVLEPGQHAATTWGITRNC
jgi:aldose 1-epimerase